MGGLYNYLDKSSIYNDKKIVNLCIWHKNITILCIEL